MQRNFETLKTVIYRAIESNTYSVTPFNLSALGGECKSYHTKIGENKKKLNKLIDNIDIRAIGSILKNIDQKLIPNWYKNNQFTIDYNSSGELDFIILKNQ